MRSPRDHPVPGPRSNVGPRSGGLQWRLHFRCYGAPPLCTLPRPTAEGALPLANRTGGLRFSLVLVTTPRFRPAARSGRRGRRQHRCPSWSRGPCDKVPVQSRGGESVRWPRTVRTAAALLFRAPPPLPCAQAPRGPGHGRFRWPPQASHLAHPRVLDSLDGAVQMHRRSAPGDSAQLAPKGALSTARRPCTAMYSLFERFNSLLLLSASPA